jgi:putative transposase
MKYKFMEEHRETHKVKSMCEVLKVSRSGYYAWNTGQSSRRQKANEELLEYIHAIQII